MSGYNEGTGLQGGCCHGSINIYTNGNGNGNGNGSFGSFLWSNFNTTVFTDSNVNIGYSNNPYKLAVNGSIYSADNVISTGAVNNNFVNANSILQNTDIINALIKFARIDDLLVSKITMLNLLGKQVFGNIKQASQTPTVATTISWENENTESDKKILAVKIGQSLSTSSLAGSRTLTFDIDTYLNPVLTFEQSHAKGTGMFDIYKTLSINVTQTPKSMTFISTTSIDTDIKSHTINLDILSIPVGLGNITIS